MGGNNSQINRFPLPENWTVDEFICAVVPVPNDPEYISMFRGLLDTLTWSRSFKLHPTEPAARQVADTWAAAFASAAITFQNCEAPMTLRQNPDNPCQLEQSSDGGETWTLAFDYSLCGDVITVPAPYPGSETGASDAAAAAVTNIFEGLLNVAEDICALTRAEYIDAATTYMRSFDASYANPVALGQIYDAYCALEPEEQDYYKSDCPYVDHKDDLENCATSDGLFDWLNCASEAIMDWLNDTSNDLMNALNSAAALLSGNGWQLSSYGGSGGGSGFGGDCDTCLVTYDPGSMAYSFVNGGHIEEGAGIDGSDCGRGDAFVSGGDNIQGVYTRIDLTPGTLNDVVLWYQIIDPVGNTAPTGISVTLFDVDDNQLGAHNNAGVTPQSDWTEFTVATGLAWTITEGDYIVVDVSENWFSYGTLAAEAITRSDNISIVGEGVC